MKQKSGSRVDKLIDYYSKSDKKKKSEFKKDSKSKKEYETATLEEFENDFDFDD